MSDVGNCIRCLDDVPKGRKYCDLCIERLTGKKQARKEDMGDYGFYGVKGA